MGETHVSEGEHKSDDHAEYWERKVYFLKHNLVLKIYLPTKMSRFFSPFKSVVSSELLLKAEQLYSLLVLTTQFLILMRYSFPKAENNKW